MRSSSHAGCGGRAGETHREQSRQGAPVRPNARGLHPTSVGPSARGGPTASLGTQGPRTFSVVPSPGPTGISRRSTGDRVACQRTEILPPWSWTSGRITKRPSSPAARPRNQTSKVKSKAQTEYLPSRAHRGDPPTRGPHGATRSPVRGHESGYTGHHPHRPPSPKPPAATAPHTPQSWVGCAPSSPAQLLG